VDHSTPPLSREEIEFLRILSKADNVYDVEILPITNCVRLKYDFKYEIAFLLCRELGMYSKLPRGIDYPPLSKLTEAQYEFIDKCREWISAHQTCPRCKSKAGQRKRIFKTKEATIHFLSERDISHKDYQTAYECPYGNGWHLRTELTKVKNNNIEALQPQSEVIEENFEEKEPEISSLSHKILNNKKADETYDSIDTRQIDFSKIKMLASVDKLRISDLKKRAQNLDFPKKPLLTLRDVITWSGRSIPIEAYFIALYKGISIEKIEIATDDTMMKLRGWLLAAGRNPDV
jgi:hypothetical protein